MTDDEYEEAFRRLRRRFSHETKRELLRGLQHMLAESEHYDEIKNVRLARRHVAVSADKTYGIDFSYHYFDFFLGVLSFLHGGPSWPGKPVNQNRVIVWRNRRSVLLSTLLFLRANYGASHDIRFSRAIVLPYPNPAIGHRVMPV
jgi:hypothetical protein